MSRAVFFSTFLLGAASFGGATLASANTVQRAGVGFATGTPRWLVSATDRTARSLGDPQAALIDLRLGRFPVVVIRGTFRCDSCPRPFGATTPTGNFAVVTFDAVTHSLHDLALSTHRPGRLPALCSGDCAGRREVAFASAQQALDAAGASVTLGDKRGSHHCLLPTHATQSGFVAATCTLSIWFGQQQMRVTFTEMWTGLDARGRRYAPDSPSLRHTWRIIESRNGWVRKLSSTGNPPPR